MFLRPLPAEQHTFDHADRVVVVGLHEHLGRRWYTRFELDDGKALADCDDLEL
jgi:hypothetical protein